MESGKTGWIWVQILEKLMVGEWDVNGGTKYFRNSESQCIVRYDSVGEPGINIDRESRKTEIEGKLGRAGRLDGEEFAKVLWLGVLK